MHHIFALAVLVLFSIFDLNSQIISSLLLPPFFGPQINKCVFVISNRNTHF